MTTATLKVAAANVQDGLRRAAEVAATRTPAQTEALEAALAQFGSRLVRMFVGEELAHKKGYMPNHTATVQDFTEFRTATPATHRWAEWEAQVTL